MNSIIRRLLRYNLREPPIVYRLIDAALIGIFLTILSYLKIYIQVIHSLWMP